jgi:hypothetical protein
MVWRIEGTDGVEKEGTDGGECVVWRVRVLCAPWARTSSASAAPLYHTHDTHAHTHVHVHVQCTHAISEKRARMAWESASTA